MPAFVNQSIPRILPMKTLPSLLLSVALIAATATAASAYSLSPPDTRARLKGTLTFTPNEGGHPFTCRIVLDIKTQGEIRAIKLPSGDCAALHFQDLPWGISVNSATSGTIGTVSFDSSSGNCIQDFNQFQDNASGVWTFPAGQCFSGTLKSDPPVTIVP
jgi:hypothetical protein